MKNTMASNMSSTVVINEADFNYEAALNDINAENYSSAVQHLNEALEIYRKFSKEEQIAYCYDKLGLCYLKMSNKPKALGYLTQAYSKRQQIYADQRHPDMLISLNSLATYYDSVDNFAEADKYRAEAERLRQRMVEGRDPEYATSINNVGVSYLRQSDFPMAMKYIEQAYNIRQQIYGERIHTDIGNSLYNMAIINLKMNNMLVAIRYAHKALEIRQKLNDYGAHSDVADTLSLLGILYFQNGDHQKSKGFSLEALRMRKIIYGENINHAKIANSYYNLGQVYGKLGDQLTSEDYLNKSFEMRRALIDRRKRMGSPKY